MQGSRRHFLAGSMAFATVATAGLGRSASALTAPSLPTSLPPPIGRSERVDRLARLRRLMAANNIGSVVVESGPSLDYLTGVQWSRSERLTGAVIPVEGAPIIVTPFFEKPSVAESLGIDAEIRTWNEDEEPLKLVADFLKSRNLAAAPIGMEETNRYWIQDRLNRQLPGARIVSANPAVRAVRMIKTTAELRLMQAANSITLEAIRAVHPLIKPGMAGSEIRAMLAERMVASGGEDPWALVLFGPASALPHGTREPQRLAAGDMVLIDTGCAVHGYQADISRSFVVGAAPTAEQAKVWNQAIRGQQIAREALKVGAPAGSVDDAVRAAYTSWGYGPGYRLPGLSHRTGHGIGMEGHEPINLVHGEQTALAPGMCFSNEPGIYLPGKFGVRFEDCFHMTPTGPEWFTVPPVSIDEPIGQSKRWD